MSESLVKKYEILKTSDEIPPCERCGRTPKSKHKTGKLCPECAYKGFEAALNAKEAQNRQARQEKSTKSSIDKKPRCFISKRLEWEQGDKTNKCATCSQKFVVQWENRNRKYCGRHCSDAAAASRMIRRNAEGNFFQSFGRRVVYENHGQNIRCDSLIEWCALEHLFQTHGDAIVSVSRSELKIPYDDAGRRRTYTPDFEILLRGGEHLIVECKSDQSGTSEIWCRYHREADLKRNILGQYAAEHGVTAVWFTQKTRRDLYAKMKSTIVSGDTRCKDSTQHDSLDQSITTRTQTRPPRPTAESGNLKFL